MAKVIKVNIAAKNAKKADIRGPNRERHEDDETTTKKNAMIAEMRAARKKKNLQIKIGVTFE